MKALRYVLFVATLLSPLWATSPTTSEEVLKLPHGINLTKQTKHYENLSTEYTYSFIQNSQKIDQIKEYRIYDFYEGDIDKDGIIDMVFQTFSGGAHCCFDIFVAHIEPKMQKLIRLPMKNAESVEFKDLDGDGIDEWIFWDDTK